MSMKLPENLFNKIKNRFLKNSSSGSGDCQNELKLEYIQKQLNCSNPKTLIDLGCGEDAFVANSVASYVQNVICVDIIESVHKQHANITYVKSEDGFSIPLANDSADALWASHILEHVCNLGNFLTEIRRVLKPQGMLIVAVPPFKYEIVNHFTTGWSPGQLAYVLAGFGFDCSTFCFYEKGYNVFGAGKKSSLIIPELTHFGYNGISIKAVTPYLPSFIQVALKQYHATNESVYRFEGKKQFAGS